MSRYIDADALKKRVSELIVPDWTRTLIRSWLDSEPTVDAVPVVRCGECKHCFVDGDNVRFNVCELTHNRVQSDDWFCADGERKDGETEQCNTYSLGKIEMPKGAMKKIIADGERKDGEHDD